MKRYRALFLLLAVLLLALAGCDALGQEVVEEVGKAVLADLERELAARLEAEASAATVADVPPYAGEPYCVLAENVPGFTEAERTTEAYETYSALDRYGRCGVAMAVVGRELMPTEERGDISSVRPAGFVNVPYSFVDGEYLYNRCHLIGFQLTGENANERNLITGTRYMNVEGMLPFENMVADYIKETGNHVLYRVTPVHQGAELVPRGVTIEALSIEDGGEGISFHVYVYNVQPGVEIDYATGESRLDEAAFQEGEQGTYVLNTGSKRFHRPDCAGAQEMKESNRQDYTGSRDLLVAQGFKACNQCKP